MDFWRKWKDPLDFMRAVGPSPADPIERLLRWILRVMIFGFIALLIGSIFMSSVAQGLWFIASGMIAALCAATVGAGLGLLFGLPVARRVTIKVAAPSATPAIPAAAGQAADPATTAAPTIGQPVRDSADEDWYDDSSSMEKIVDWLTTVIVGLGLTQWQAIANQFDRLAAATSLGMGIGLTALDELNGRGGRELLTLAGQIVQASGSKSPETIREALRLAERALAGEIQVPDGLKLVGGAILLGYSVLGFVAMFLWARRYLKEAFSMARVASTMTQRMMADAQAVGNMQMSKRDSRAFAKAERAVEAAGQRAAAAEARRPDEGNVEGTPPALGEIVTPNPNSPDDPWFGMFGGRSTAGGMTLSATVRELDGSKDMFSVQLRLAPVDELAREAQAGQAARIYLHPTFQRPIRELRLDANGELTLNLIAYGAFTAGAQLSGNQKLELDLSTLPGVPQIFRDR